MEYEYGEKVEEEEVPQKYSSNSGSRLKLLFTICFVLVVVALGVVYYPSSEDSFPKLVVGSYVGEIRGIGGDEIKIYVESLPSDELLISAVQGDFEPQRVAVIFNSDDEENSILPLVLKLNGSSWKFVGEKGGNGFSGTLLQQGGKKKGTWSLASLEQSERAFVLDDEQLNAWVKLTNQYEILKQDIALMKIQVASQTKEIEKLTDFMTDGDRLKVRAEKKYRDVTAKLEEKSVELKKVESEAQVLENQLEIAQEVTDMGRLVLLARQSLDRENRWIDSVLGSELPNQGEDFQQELEQAKKILSVKKAIQEEEEYVAHLRNLIAGTGEQNIGEINDNQNVRPQNQGQPSSFGSLWGDN